MKISPIEVTLIDYCGSDLSTVNAARVSFHKESKEFVEQDAKLINYLAKHKHHSPFNHAFISVRVKAPIFVARQLVKHKFMPWNEVSRRYVDDEPEFYAPGVWRKKAVNVKQGSSGEALPPPQRTGKCLHCKGDLPAGRYKFCTDSHQAAYSQAQNPLKTRFSRWKATAKQDGIAFTITEDDLDWPDTCPYLGMQLNYSPDGLADNVASLDKIEPAKGYVPGNVQIISLLANKMKSSATHEQIMTFAKNASMIHGGVFIEKADSYEGYLEQCTRTYNSLIAQGYCAEQARMFMPQSMMVEWYWSGTLGAFGDMLKLRLDPHTQKETRDVAEMIKGIVEPLFPVSLKAMLEN